MNFLANPIVLKDHFSCSEWKGFKGGAGFGNSGQGLLYSAVMVALVALEKGSGRQAQGVFWRLS